MVSSLNDDELSLVSGGMKNADLPGVKAALTLSMVFFSAAAARRPRRPRSPIPTVRSARPAAAPRQIARPLDRAYIRRLNSAEHLINLGDNSLVLPGYLPRNPCKPMATTRTRTLLHS